MLLLSNLYKPELCLITTLFDLSLFSFVLTEEMDWDKNGTVTFKEFLFAFTRWVGIDENEDEE